MRSLDKNAGQTTYVQFHHAILPYLKTFTSSEWMVFTALAMHMDSNGYCFPSIGAIATITGLSVPTVRRALDGLDSAEVNGMKVLSMKYRYDKNGRQTSNGYILFPDADTTKSDGEEGAKTDTVEGVKNSTPITLNKSHIEQEPQRTVVGRPRTLPKLPLEGDPGRAIYEAYRSVIYPELYPSDFTIGEWTGVRHIVYQMHAKGIDALTVENAARNLVTKWNGKRDIVTMHALWKHWSAATTGTPVVKQQGKPSRSMEDIATSAIDVFRKVSGSDL